ncbi:hypothetical protein [Prosthecomicrobium sp. N25]|uniref:hypothetical protein n=1 Tax=Prosthecomicrobium sp. N25 TaxID=3129254 RepID=UPI003077644E
MGKLAFLFLLLAAAIAYDAITYDGAYSKSAWREIRAAGSDLETRIGRIGDGAGDQRADRRDVGL